MAYFFTIYSSTEFMDFNRAFYSNAIFQYPYQHQHPHPHHYPHANFHSLPHLPPQDSWICPTTLMDLLKNTNKPQKVKFWQLLANTAK